MRVKQTRRSPTGGCDPNRKMTRVEKEDLQRYVARKNDEARKSDVGDHTHLFRSPEKNLCGFFAHCNKLLACKQKTILAHARARLNERPDLSALRALAAQQDALLQAVTEDVFEWAVREIPPHKCRYKCLCASLLLLKCEQARTKDDEKTKLLEAREDTWYGARKRDLMVGAPCADPGIDAMVRNPDVAVTVLSSRALGLGFEERSRLRVLESSHYYRPFLADSRSIQEKEAYVLHTWHEWHRISQTRAILSRLGITWEGWVNGEARLGNGISGYERDLLNRSLVPNYPEDWQYKQTLGIDYQLIANRHHKYWYDRSINFRG